MNTFEQVNTKKAIVGLEKAVDISIRESLFWIWLHNLMKPKEIALFAKNYLFLLLLDGIILSGWISITILVF